MLDFINKPKAFKLNKPFKQNKLKSDLALAVYVVSYDEQ